jgi:hypothetical protein
MTRETSEGTCDRCTRTFAYYLIHNGLNESCYAYCSACGMSAVIDTRYEDRTAEGFPRHRSITSAAEQSMAPCPCGGSFKARAAPRCPHCTEKLSATAASGWIEASAASPMITTIGLPGPRANAKRECGNMYRQVVYGARIPTRELVCRGPDLWGYLREDQHVTLDALTRRINNAHRYWAVPDSSSWQRTRDSVALTMQRLGGRRISCWTSPNPSLLHIRDTQFWKFPSYSVRFISYRTDDDHKRSPWLLQLDGYPTLPFECVMDPWRYNR